MCLGRLTGLDYSRVFRVARRGQEIKAPTYVFMTDEVEIFTVIDYHCIGGAQGYLKKRRFKLKMLMIIEAI
jgi:hypothetical protein